MFFEIATAKEERKSGTVRGRSGPQIANARAEPESNRKTVEGPANAGLRRVYGVFSFMKRPQEHWRQTGCMRRNLFVLSCMPSHLKIKWLTKFRQRIVKRKNAESIALRIRGGFSIRCGIGGAPT